MVATTNPSQPPFLAHALSLSFLTGSYKKTYERIAQLKSPNQDLGAPETALAAGTSNDREATFQMIKNTQYNTLGKTFAGFELRSLGTATVLSRRSVDTSLLTTVVVKKPNYWPSDGKQIASTVLSYHVEDNGGNIIQLQNMPSPLAFSITFNNFSITGLDLKCVYFEPAPTASDPDAGSWSDVGMTTGIVTSRTSTSAIVQCSSAHATDFSVEGVVPSNSPPSPPTPTPTPTSAASSSTTWIAIVAATSAVGGVLLLLAAGAAWWFLGGGAAGQSAAPAMPLDEAGSHGMEGKASVDEVALDEMPSKAVV